MNTIRKILGALIILITFASCDKYNIVDDNFVGVWTWHYGFCSQTITINSDHTGAMETNNSSKECFNRFSEGKGIVYIRGDKLRAAGTGFTIINKPQKTGITVNGLPQWKMTLQSSFLYLSENMDFYKYSL